jgi:hypothetical protein
MTHPPSNPPSTPRPTGPPTGPGRPALTPEQRSLRARLAAHQRWANTGDRSAATAPAREAAASRFERQVDPDGVLSPVERAARAESAKRAYFTRLALQSSRARAKAATPKGHPTPDPVGPPPPPNPAPRPAALRTDPLSPHPAPPRPTAPPVPARAA